MGKKLRTQGLYWDDEAQAWISTHSMLKTFRRCPKQAAYKYVERLKPKYLGRPLRLGTWMHELEDFHAKGGDWREKHDQMRQDVWAPMFDEEKDSCGDLPGDAEKLMLSYLWYYKDDDFKVLESEFVLEAELPDGSIYRAKIDWLIENQFGLWIVDHKWHARLPSQYYRILDSQSADYVWAALKNGIPVQGHIWNYGRSKPASTPELTKTGLIGRWASMDTDYPTMARFFKEHFDGKIPPRYQEKMRRLKAQRYREGTPQTSSLFFRSVLERRGETLSQVARELYHTHTRMHDYPWDRPNIIERVPDRSCDFMCSYTDLCMGELHSGSRPIGWQKRYKVGDPMDYYNDDRQEKQEN